MLARTSLDRAWHFRRLPAGTTPATALGAVATAPAGEAETVELPHTPFAPDLDGRAHWFGLCAYQRALHVPDAPALAAAGQRFVLHVGAAMHTAQVFVDAQLLATHVGGYLPFEADLTAVLADGASHTLTLVLDNRDAADVPPGKPYADLDFCWYGGLYRGVELRTYPPVHVTDAVAAGEIAGGGVFFRTLAATPEQAVVAVQVHVRNTSPHVRAVALEVELHHAGRRVAREHSPLTHLAAGRATHLGVEFSLAQPALWNLDTPHLHDLSVTLVAADGTVLDRRVERCGVRRFTISRARGFELNGRRVRPRGTNRHQEYPFAGYAVPPAADRRDARRLKEAGFDYVRLAHYPQAPEFLDACDELGILVMNPIPGWQFLGGEAFRAACFQHARDLIRRDRNHPCVVLWELSLNETPMDDPFMAELHRIGHEEYPGDQMATCGWIDRYDVFTHSRQHGELHRWHNGDKALVVAEYGDWEFYASNHGFDQKTGAGLFAPWSHGRQRRAAGERGLRQQAGNHVVALNDCLSTIAALDGQWSIFDYARGYDPQRAACGIADIFRLPKFSWWFYRSQRHAHEDGGTAWSGGPVVFIASHWTPASDLRVLVFSNCDEIELRLDGLSLGRQRPAFTATTQFLPHPPFVFDLPHFTPGTLEAIGYLHGHAQPAAMHRVATPQGPAQLVLCLDEAGIAAATDEPDVLLAHAALLDAGGTLCVTALALPVTFTLADHDGVTLLGPKDVDLEAGIASTVVRVVRAGTRFTLRASVQLDLAASALTTVTAEVKWSRPQPTAASPESAAASTTPLLPLAAPA